jgi:hypothetical protein
MQLVGEACSCVEIFLFDTRPAASLITSEMRMSRNPPGFGGNGRWGLVPHQSSSSSKKAEKRPTNPGIGFDMIALHVIDRHDLHSDRRSSAGQDPD